MGFLRWCFYAHAVDDPFCVAGHFFIGQEKAEIPIVTDVCNNRVKQNTHAAKNTGGPTLFCQHGKAVFDGFSAIFVDDGLTFFEHFAALVMGNAKNGFQ